MSVPQSVAEILNQHVTFELECIDRMYLNVYVPPLQCEPGVVKFFRGHRGHPFASSALMDPMTKSFVASMERFAKQEQIPVVQFRKGQRKDEVMAEHLARFDKPEGVVLLGKAQEKTPVFRTEKRRNPETGKTYPWIVRSTAMINQYYWYCLDRDFGPFFLKFASYFPYNAKLCLNGHEYAKCQLRREGIGFKALDNGFVSSENPERLQTFCEEMGPQQIDGLLRRWLSRLPHPFTAQDREAGYRYDISILQAEFSLTQVLDRPLHGRILFEEIIRENLDIGRPDMVQLIFNRRVTKRTPGRFRTRVLTDGVIPSLHVDYKNSRIKQYFKQVPDVREVGARTETTVNNTRDFSIGKRLCNLPALRQVGFQANRRLLEVQRLSHDCAMGEETLHRLNRPVEVNGQRTSALRITDLRVLALWHLLVWFRMLPCGFANRDLREQLAVLTGQSPHMITQGRMTYDLRRLRLHGMIERIPKTHRYRVTDFGLRAALYFTRVHARLYRPGVAQILSNGPPMSAGLQRAFHKLETEIDQQIQRAKLAA
ncbi:MAG TPA: hypothetical protein VEK84_08645 [Terriglobales bacterium]|nr:hypothetical protein [Terriglobales bacterium]